MASLNVTVPYLVTLREPNGSKPGHYRYRRVIPPEVRPAFLTVDKRGKGKLPKVWLHSFRPGTPFAEIEATCRTLARQHDHWIARAKAGELISDHARAGVEEAARFIIDEGGSDEFLAHSNRKGVRERPDPAVVNAVRHGGRYVPGAVTLSQARERYRMLRGKEDARLAIAIQKFVAFAGDKDVREIRRADVSGWIADERAKGLRPSSIRRQLNPLAAMVRDTLLDFEHDGPNPFAGHKIEGAAHTAGDKLPFNTAMLDAIDKFLAESKRTKPETRYMLQLMKGTGAGVRELGGTVLSDFALDDDVPHVWIRPNAIRSALKTDERPRQIPLIGEALEAARAVCAIAAACAKGTPASKAPVFSAWKPDNARWADYLDARLNKALRAAGIPGDKRLAAGSFRHTVEEAMRAAGVREDLRLRIQGRAGKGVSWKYGATLGDLRELRKAMAKTHVQLGKVNSAIYDGVKGAAKFCSKGVAS